MLLNAIIFFCVHLNAENAPMKMTLSQTWYATYSAKQFFYYTSHYTNTDKSVRFWTECIVYASFILDYSGIEKRERERKWMDISAAIRSLTTTRIRIRALYSCQLNRLKCNSFFSDVSNKERAIYFYLRPLFWILMQSSAVNYSLNFSNNFREERNSAWCQRCFSIWPIDGDNGSIWCWQEYTLEYSRRICVSVTKSSLAKMCEFNWKWWKFQWNWRYRENHRERKESIKQLD